MRLKSVPWYSRLAAMLILIALLPFAVVLYIIVRLDSPGPFLFKQKRPGLGGRTFYAYKVRTMAVGAEKATALGTKGDGMYVTRVGKVLRKLKIDELPQFLNIVRGEMAFVGPRPIPEALFCELAENIPQFVVRSSVAPGLTNLAQITLAENGLGDKLLDDWKIRFQLELHYIRNRNLYYDWVVIGLTALFVLRRVWRPVVARLSRFAQRRQPLLQARPE